MNVDDAGELVSPADEAVSVRFDPMVLILIALNVARPVPSVVVLLPEAIVPAEGARVTVVPLVGTEFPNWSCS